MYDLDKEAYAKAAQFGCCFPLRLSINRQTVTEKNNTFSKNIVRKPTWNSYFSRVSIALLLASAFRLTDAQTDGRIGTRGAACTSRSPSLVIGSSC